MYGHEKDLFFYDPSQDPTPDPSLAWLLPRPNVLITGHQGFLTREALGNITTTALGTLDQWLAGQAAPNELTAAPA